MTPKLGFFARLKLALQILLDGDLAGRLALPAPAEALEPEVAAPATTGSGRSALQLLGAFQREGRFLDFVQDEVAGVTDADVGAAARLVHSGCQKVVQRWFAPAPVWTGDEEGARVTVPPGFDAHEIRLTGRVEGQAPFEGELIHGGWKAGHTALPELTSAARPEILMPAEVELGGGVDP